jgi:GNAT superfamily N-acetyltransferase
MNIPEDTEKNLMSPKLDIRLEPAQLEQFSAIATLFEKLHSFNASLNKKFALAPNWREILYEQFSQTYQSNSALWLLAWKEDQPVGFLILQAKAGGSPLFQNSQRIELVALYVETEFHGTGLAQQLMQAAKTWAELHGASYMSLYVTAQNDRARTFYQHCGWHPAQEIWHMDITPHSPSP